MSDVCVVYARMYVLVDTHKMEQYKIRMMIW